jgi:hypothetical protein
VHIYWCGGSGDCSVDGIKDVGFITMTRDGYFSGKTIFKLIESFVSIIIYYDLSKQIYIHV